MVGATDRPVPETPATCRTADGLELAVSAWVPARPRVAVVLVHGYAEHAARYAHVAERFAPRGLALIGADLRGHGRSPGVRGHVVRFEDYHLDVRAMLDHARARLPDCPQVLFGHSMGGLVTLDHLRAGLPQQVRGAVLSSPFLGLAQPPSALTQGFARLLDLVYPSFRLPSKLEGSRVCGDADLRRAYDGDPLRFGHVTVRWALEALRAIDRVHAHDFTAFGSLSILAAGDDAVVDVAATRRFAERAGLGSRFEVLAGYRHELVNEPAGRRELAIERIADWIEAAADSE